MTSVLLYTLGVVFLILGIGVSIGLHELGHMIPAKRFGVKVTQYFVGFGPTLWSTRRGETEYGVKWVPLGGYVKLVGMLPPSPGDEAGKIRKSNTGIFSQLISDARSAEYELVEPGDEDRLFYRKTWWRKLIVMSGGPLVNIAIAFLLFGGIFLFHGVAEGVDPVASAVSSCSAQTCADAGGRSPAQQAGIRKGDRITSFNGQQVTTWDQLVPLIHDGAGNPARIGVLRDGKTLQLRTTISTLPKSAGKLAGEGFLGLSPSIRYVSKGPGYTVVQMGSYSLDTAKAVLNLPVKLYGVGRTVLGLQPRAQDSPVSVVGAGRFAGETAATTTSSVADRFVSVLGILAGINLFLGMFNFVPLLPLDGGHIAGALYEAVRRGFAKLFHRPDPGYFDVAKLLPVAYTVAGALLVMSVLLIYADLVAPVKA